MFLGAAFKTRVVSPSPLPARTAKEGQFVFSLALRQMPKQDARCEAFSYSVGVCRLVALPMENSGWAKSVVTRSPHPHWLMMRIFWDQIPHQQAPDLSCCRCSDGFNARFSQGLWPPQNASDNGPMAGALVGEVGRRPWKRCGKTTAAAGDWRKPAT